MRDEIKKLLSDRLNTEEHKKWLENERAKQKEQNFKYEPFSDANFYSDDYIYKHFEMINKESKDKHNEFVKYIEKLYIDKQRLNRKNSIQTNIIIYLTVGMFLLAALTVYLTQNPNS